MIIDRQRLMADILKSEEASEDWNKGEYHQAILDVCYEAWNLKENEAWDYKDLINHARFTYGEFAEFIVLAGKTNQQVTNGGFDQLFANGYASGEGGCFGQHTTTPMLSRLIRLMGDFGLDKTEIGAKVLEIMEFAGRAFKRELSREDYEDDQESNNDIYSGADDDYFAVDDPWMKYLNQLAKDVLDGKDIAKAA